MRTDSRLLLAMFAFRWRYRRWFLRIDGARCLHGPISATAGALHLGTSSLCYEMMLGWDPAVDLRQVMDDMTNDTKGFSFVLHPGKTKTIKSLSNVQILGFDEGLSVTLATTCGWNRPKSL